MTDTFIWDKDTEHERMTDWRETVDILKEINHEFVKDDCAIQYSHQVRKETGYSMVNSYTYHGCLSLCYSAHY